MQYLDTVKVININKEYEKDGVSLGDIGVIWDPEIKDNCFYVMFERKTSTGGFVCKYSIIDVKDLILIEKGICDDALLKKDLPNKNISLWCKVENGYILNLKGQRKNKIPYEYDS